MVKTEFFYSSTFIEKQNKQKKQHMNYNSMTQKGNVKYVIQVNRFNYQEKNLFKCFTGDLPKELQISIPQCDSKPAL